MSAVIISASVPQNLTDENYTCAKRSVGDFEVQWQYNFLFFPTVIQDSDDERTPFLQNGQAVASSGPLYS